MSFTFTPDLTPEFRLTFEQRDGRWSVVASGILDVANAAAVVQPELIRLHDEAVRQGVSTVGLEVGEIEYINSSGLKSFMAWFLTAANERQGKYRIEVSYDPSRPWQHSSFRPMERLAPQTVKLVPRNASPGSDA